MASLRTKLDVLTEGGRVSVIDNTLWPENEDQPCATVRVTLSRERAVEIPGFADAQSEIADPTLLPIRTRKAAHGKPWFMDAMETRVSEEIAWFRLSQPVIDGAGPLSCVRPGGLDPRHRAADPERGRRSQPQPDRPALQAACRRLGRYSRANPMEAGDRLWSRERCVAGRARRDWPCFDVGGVAAVSETRHGGELSRFPNPFGVFQPAHRTRRYTRRPFRLA